VPKYNRLAVREKSACMVEIQAEIARRLRAEYDLACPAPVRLVELARQLEPQQVEFVSENTVKTPPTLAHRFPRT
jgi:hypothetical protein